MSYKKLWHLLLDRELNKAWLRDNGIHSATIAKMSKGEAISTETITKLCALLGCQPGDIMEYVPYTQGADGTVTVKIPPDIFTDEEKKELSKE